MRPSSIPKNRIDERFANLRKEGRKAFVAYITAGDPNLATTAKLARSFEQVGVDVLELGVPFSDPLADGVVNQLAADRGLKAGTTLSGILGTIRKLRRQRLELPIVLFTYFNPIHRYGVQRFIKDAIRAGVDGILNLDLPPEESDVYAKLMKQAGLHSVYLIAPNTPPARIHAIAQKSCGFIYYVSREGVTGMRKNLAGGIASRIDQIRKNTKVPIVVGFGISSPSQVLKAAKLADGCVVGSAIVQRICELNRKPSLVPQVTRFVSSLVKPLRK